LENLIEALPERRRPSLNTELSMLKSSAMRTFPDLDDQALAQMSDLQGIGGTQVQPAESDRVEGEVVV